MPYIFLGGPTFWGPPLQEAAMEVKLPPCCPPKSGKLLLQGRLYLPWPGEDHVIRRRRGGESLVREAGLLPLCLLSRGSRGLGLAENKQPSRRHGNDVPFLARVTAQDLGFVDVARRRRCCPSDSGRGRRRGGARLPAGTRSVVARREESVGCPR